MSGRRRKNAVLERVEYVAYRAVSSVVRRMSEERVVVAGARVGTVARHLLRGRDRLALRNLTATFPEKSPVDLRRILDDTWRHFGREVLQFMQAQTLSLDEIRERCPFVNEEILHAAVERGRGTIIITAHLGGWEIAGLAVMARVRDVTTVVRPLDNSLLERDVEQLRARTGAVIVDRRRAARALTKALAGNGAVAILPDQAVQAREGILVPFLGRDAWTTDAPAKLALRYGSTIVFGFCIPTGARHEFELGETILVDELSEAERNPVALTRRINDVISERIRRDPELWLWMHDRWKGTGERD